MGLHGTSEHAEAKADVASTTIKCLCLESYLLRSLATRLLPLQFDHFSYTLYHFIKGLPL